MTPVTRHGWTVEAVYLGNPMRHEGVSKINYLIHSFYI